MTQVSSKPVFLKGGVFVLSSDIYGALSLPVRLQKHCWRPRSRVRRCAGNKIQRGGIRKRREDSRDSCQESVTGLGSSAISLTGCLHLTAGEKETCYNNHKGWSCQKKVF